MNHTFAPFSASLYIMFKPFGAVYNLRAPIVKS